MNMNERLRAARLKAGYMTATGAAKAHGWRATTYNAHENGQNEYSVAFAREYAKAFKTTPEWLLLGISANITTSDIDARLSDLPENISARLRDKFITMIEAVELIRK